MELMEHIPTPYAVRWHYANADRNVTLVCGPPGAGKTTFALTRHPETHDIGEMERGTPRERMRAYGKRAWKIGRNESANIAVVRGAPDHKTRTHLEHLTRPALTVVMLTSPELCHERIRNRNRDGYDGRDLDGQHSAVEQWWEVWETEPAHYGAPFLYFDPSGLPARFNLSPPVVDGSIETETEQRSEPAKLKQNKCTT